jgi:hypothetical protein
MRELERALERIEPIKALYQAVYIKALYEAVYIAVLYARTQTLQRREHIKALYETLYEALYEALYIKTVWAKRSGGSGGENPSLSRTLI